MAKVIQSKHAPRGSSPYYLFGYQRKYPFAWHGGAGGIPWSERAAESRELGNADMIESGLDPNFLPYPAFKHTVLHDPSLELAGLGDFPLMRPAGPEPDGLGFSDNEKMLGAVALAAGVVYFLWKKRKKRR